MKKNILDMIMLVLFIVMNGYHLVSDNVHEYLGMVLLVLFIIHQWLNMEWYKKLLKGRLTYIKGLFIVINALLMFAFLLSMISGLSISEYLFVSLPMSLSSFMRKVHLVATAWTYILIALHTGLHLQMFKNIIAKKVKKKNYLLCEYLLYLLGIFGVYAFIQRNIISDMLLLTDYKFLPYKENVVNFAVDYISILCTFMIVGYLFMNIKKYFLLKTK